MPKLSELVAGDSADESSGSTKLGDLLAASHAQFAGPDQTMDQAVKSDAGGLASLDFTNPSNMGNVLHHGVPMLAQVLGTIAGGGAGSAIGPTIGRLGAAAGSGIGSLLGYLYQSGAEPMMKGQTPTTTASGALGNTLLGSVLEGGAQLSGALNRRVLGKSQMLAEGEQAAVDAEAAMKAKRVAAEQAQTAKLADVGNVAEAKAFEDQQAYDAARAGAEQDQIAKRADVAKAAEADTLAARTEAQSAVQTRKQLLDQLTLKTQQNALAGLKDEEVARRVNAALAPSTPLAAPTIDQLAERAAPVRESVQRSVRGIFGGLSSQFSDLLSNHLDKPVEATGFRDAVDAQRSILSENKEVVGKRLSNIMDDLAQQDPSSPVQIGNLPPILKQEYYALQRSGQLTPDQINAHIRRVAAGLQGPQGEMGQAMLAPPTVKSMDEVRKKLTGIVIGDSSPLEKRVANRLIQDAIDPALGNALPPEVSADWATLRRNWHEANNVFSPNFKSKLFRAASPAAVADTLYGAAKAGNGDRVMTVIGQTPKDELPPLRSAFADRLTQGNVVKNVEGLDPRIFKAFFNGTGFDNPKAWTENIANGIDLTSVASNPALYARWNQRVQDGLKSFGMKRYQAALDRAELQLKSIPDPGKAIQDSLSNELTPEQAGDMAMRGEVRPNVGQARAEAVSKELTPNRAGIEATADMEQPGTARTRGQMEGMKTPLLGKRMQSYVEHRTAFHTLMAITSLGALGGGFLHHPILSSIPLAYLGSSKLANMALSNPTTAKIWYQALKSPNLETAGFWFGRLAAASLSEGVRDSK